MTIIIADREYNERDQRDVGCGHVPVLTARQCHGSSIEGSNWRALRRRVHRLLRSRSCDLQNPGVAEPPDSTVRLQVRSQVEIIVPRIISFR